MYYKTTKIYRAQGSQLLVMPSYVTENVWVARLCSPAGKDEHELQIWTSPYSLPGLCWTYLKLFESSEDTQTASLLLCTGASPPLKGQQDLS